MLHYTYHKDIEAIKESYPSPEYSECLRNFYEYSKRILDACDSIVRNADSLSLPMHTECYPSLKQALEVLTILVKDSHPNADIER